MELHGERLATVLASIGYLSRYFSHAWVAGPPQYEFVRRLGFERKNIIFDYYCADLPFFNETYHINLEHKSTKYPHRFLFVGRLEPSKGLDVLIQSWESLGGKRRDWELHLIGTGSLRKKLETCQGVTVKDLAAGRLDERGHRSWLLGASQPFRALGWSCMSSRPRVSPLILSDVVGAGSTFLISGMNGFAFPSENSQALALRMEQIINKTDKGLIEMSKQSHLLGQRITPETAANNLLSVMV